MLENNTLVTSLKARVTTLETNFSNIKPIVSTNSMTITNLTTKIEEIENRPTRLSFESSANFTSLVNRVSSLENTGPAVDDKSNTWYDYYTFFCLFLLLALGRVRIIFE